MTTTLLIVGGPDLSIHAYDVRSGTWRTVGAARLGGRRGCAFVPFLYSGDFFAWISRGNACTPEATLRLISLRRFSGATVVPENLLIHYRGNATFLFQFAHKPALFIGGNAPSEAEGSSLSSAVDAVSPDRRVVAMPPLIHSRSGANAFRMNGGVLVVGGKGNIPAKQVKEEFILPGEWLAEEQTTGGRPWAEVSGVGVASSSAVGQASDSSLIEVTSDDTVNRIRLVKAQNGQLTFVRNSLPKLNRPRVSDNSGSEGNNKPKVRGLADGRIIVAGGSVRAEKIALLKTDSDRIDAVDEYISIGKYLPSRRHEIYNPSNQRWTNSAPSMAAGGPVAILDDGRVVKVGSMQGKGSDINYVIEISNSEGTAWTTFGPDSGLHIKLSYSTRPFVIDGELFLSGEYEGLSAGGGPSGVQWLNSSNGRWETLWQSGPNDNWRDHVGRVIVRLLANGKRIVIPVEGSVQ